MFHPADEPMFSCLQWTKASKQRRPPSRRRLRFQSQSLIFYGAGAETCQLPKSLGVRSARKKPPWFWSHLIQVNDTLTPYFRLCLMLVGVLNCDGSPLTQEGNRNDSWAQLKTRLTRPRPPLPFRYFCWWTAAWKEGRLAARRGWGRLWRGVSRQCAKCSPTASVFCRSRPIAAPKQATV